MCHEIHGTYTVLCVVFLFLHLQKKKKKNKVWQLKTYIS